MLCSVADQALQESSQRVCYEKDHCNKEANRIIRGGKPNKLFFVIIFIRKLNN